MTRPRIREDFALAVQDYLLIEQTELIPADFALIFGNRNIIEPLARQTAQLYHSGHFPLIVASGGVKTRAGTTEAEALRQKLIRQGVPDHAILTENHSTHTGENVTLTRALLAKKGLDSQMASVIGIGHIVAARRFLMTLERHWPQLHKMHVSANPFNLAAQDWHTHPTFRSHALEEWRKIAPYLAEDKIREVDLAELNRVTRLLRTSCNSGPPGPGPDQTPDEGMGPDGVRRRLKASGPGLRP